MRIETLAVNAANALERSICSAPIEQRISLRTRLERVVDRFELMHTEERGYMPSDQVRWSDILDRYLAEEDAYECEHCSGVTISRNLSGVYVRRLRGGSHQDEWCETCRQNDSTICVNCHVCWRDSDLERDDTGEAYCASCFQEHEEEEEDNTESLPSYHAGYRAPLPIDYMRPLYSAELEAEAGDRDGLVCALRTLASQQSPRWLGWERDGSLNDNTGVELLVSMLPSLNALKNALQSLTPIVRKYGGTSWDNGRCGLHINSNCLHWSKVRKARLLYLVHKLRPLLEEISGRKNAHWCLWPDVAMVRPRYDSLWTRGALSRWGQGELGKYLCVRMDSQRIEWRMFRGTLRASRIALYCATVAYLEDASGRTVHDRLPEITCGLKSLASSLGFSI